MYMYDFIKEKISLSLSKKKHVYMCVWSQYLTELKDTGFNNSLKLVYI